METTYRTSELELASFLKTRGHKLMGAKPLGRIVEFTFDGDAASDLDAYIGGAEVSARELFEAHRSLRALIQQVKESQFQRSGEKYGSNHRSSW
jgi:hypothetical protein